VRQIGLARLRTAIALGTIGLALAHAGAATAADLACGDCHDVDAQSLAATPHGFLGCADCHAGAQDFPHRVEDLAPDCSACHPDALERFRAGVHASSLGDQPGTCGTCHGAIHGLVRHDDPASPLHPPRVSATCGACHPDVAAAYGESVHAEALSRGVHEAPTCTDCHGEHRILSPREAGSPVHPSNIPRQTCGRCHGDLRLAGKLGLPAEPVSAFESSYHGLALRAGATTVAHCGSCHGVHDVLPSSDPRSSIHPDNLPATCGQCHPGAGAHFPIGTIHVLEGHGEHPVVRVVRVAYLWLIVVSVGAMLLHNGLDFLRKLRLAPLPSAPPVPEPTERMSRGFRVAHALLIATFAVLVYTGFALKYPEAWWTQPLLQWEDRLAVRGLLHRAAAIVLLGALAFHLVHLCLDPRERARVAAMRPRRSDWVELRERMAWALGRRPTPPRSAAVGYPEKVEYLALLWGIAIMSVTGFALWMNDLLLRWLPKWVADLATVVHWYEAVLAMLAILVWHFYFVIFDPVVYPMDKAWLSGRSHPARVREREPEAGPPPEG
jgi:cytochrome b subunit of formate dehydrogenase